MAAKMIYPHRWQIKSYFDKSICAYVVSGLFSIAGKRFVIAEYQEDKEDMTYINKAVESFWRKRGAM